MTIQNAKRAAEKLFKDSLTVYRVEGEKGADGIYSEKEKVIYRDVPCSLYRYSQRMSSIAKDEKSLPESYEMYTIIAPPDVLIAAGDRVEIKSGGMVYIGRSGRTHVYSTHGDTRMRVWEIV